MKHPFWAEEGAHSGDHWELKTETEIDGLFQVRYKEKSEFFWVGYPNEEFNREFLFGPRQQERYEKFCIGFLYFYDAHVNTTKDHSIYFEWFEREVVVNDRKVMRADRVNIYISPRPLQRRYEISVDPPPPTDIEFSDPPKPPPPPPPEMGFENVII